MSALTTSAPSLAKPFAFALFTSLVSTRAAKVRFGSLRIARTKPPPCAPVAPTTVITFLLHIATFFLPHRRSHRGSGRVNFRFADSGSRSLGDSSGCLTVAADGFLARGKENRTCGSAHVLEPAIFFNLTSNRRSN